MANTQRHLRGDTNEVQIDIHGHTVVEQGDMMFINNVVGNIAAPHGGTADYYGFPADETTGSSVAFDSFIGVAMTGSESGTTEEIAVATSGIFRFANASAVASKVGYTVSGATSGTAGTLLNQSCQCSPKATTYVDARIGYCVDDVGGTSTIDVMILSVLSGVTWTG